MFQKVWGIEIFHEKRGGGITISHRKFLVSQDWKIFAGEDF